MNAKLNAMAAVIAGAALQLCPQAWSITVTSMPGVTIPDDNILGVADTIHLSTSINFVTDVTVNLDITGGYNGDFYAYLRHGITGFAVLLNRVGRTSGNPFGSSDSGFNVTLSDAAPNDIHLASAGGGMPLTGTYQADGRVPLSGPAFDAFDTTARTALLNSFNGMNANGDWTLFIADVSPVGIGTLTDWSLTVDGRSVTVPDGGLTAAWLAIAWAGLFVLHPQRRQTSSRAT